jgi:hypothetical protein
VEAESREYYTALLLEKLLCELKIGLELRELFKFDLNHQILGGYCFYWN